MEGFRSIHKDVSHFILANSYNYIDATIPMLNWGRAQRTFHSAIYSAYYRTQAKNKNDIEHSKKPGLCLLSERLFPWLDKELGGYLFFGEPNGIFIVTELQAKEKFVVLVVGQCFSNSMGL